MRKSFYPVLAAILAGCVTPVVAADADTIIVTASRTAQTEDESLASVSVITRGDIERLQAQSLQDLLRGVPGLSLSNSGGPGKVTSLFIRGTESDHVLVLVDGIKLGSATSGTTSFQDLPIDLIERIEIVRGPRSSLYGSEAIGGVIQIFTRRGGGDPEQHLRLELGSRDTHNGSVGLSGGGERGWYGIDLALRDTDGIDACHKHSGSGCYGLEPDEDGYRNMSGSLRGGYRFDNGIEVDLHALRADGENAFDGSYVNESETRQQVLGGTLRYAPTDAWLLTLAGGRSWDESDNFKDGVFRTTYDTRHDNLSLQGDLDLDSDRLLTLGFDYLDERVESTTHYLFDSRDNRGYFLQYQGEHWAQELQLSLRQDKHDAFGRHTTGGLAWGYALNPRLRLMASYATAFKAPTFNELYYPGFGNPDLQPEESQSLEFGIKGGTGGGVWSLSLYQTRVDELIGFDAYYVPSNIDRARIRGIEAQLNTALGPWQSAASLTLLDPVNRSDGDREGNQLPRRPRQSLRVDIDRELDAFAFGITLLAEGRRYDDLDNNHELGGFGSVDLRGSYRINNAWRLQGRCENLFDKNYESATNYNQPGRAFYLTLSYQS